MYSCNQIRVPLHLYLPAQQVSKEIFVGEYIALLWTLTVIKMHLNLNHKSALRSKLGTNRVTLLVLTLLWTRIVLVSSKHFALSLSPFFCCSIPFRANSWGHWDILVFLICQGSPHKNLKMFRKFKFFFNKYELFKKLQNIISSLSQSGFKWLKVQVYNPSMRRV